MANLTDLQQAWLDAYLQHWNATQAARDAGYKAKSDNVFRAIGHENRHRPEIAAEIERFVEERAMDRNELLVELGEQARLDLGEYVAFSKGLGEPYVDLRAMIADGQGRFIKAIKKTKHGINIEFQDPFAAKQQIASLLDRPATGREDDPIHYAEVSEVRERIKHLVNRRSPTDGEGSGN